MRHQKTSDETMKHRKTNMGRHMAKGHGRGDHKGGKEADEPGCGGNGGKHKGRLGMAGRGRGRKKMGRLFGHGELRLILLALVEKQPSHGYELIKAVEQATGGIYAPSPGVLYPTLTQLLESGLIQEVNSDDSARKSYQLTAEGQAELEASRAQVERIFSQLQVMASPERNSHMETVREHVERIKGLLRHSMMNPDIDQTKLNDIGAALSAAADKIEKIVHSEEQA